MNADWLSYLVSPDRSRNETKDRKDLLVQYNFNIFRDACYVVRDEIIWKGKIDIDICNQEVQGFFHKMKGGSGGDIIGVLVIA